jgi:hypothetical protein
LAADELVGENDALESELPRHLQLVHGGEGDGPGPVPQLTAEELRAHCRLAVWGDHRARTRKEALHPVTVVAEGTLLQHCQRQRQILP